MNYAKVYQKHWRSFKALLGHDQFIHRIMSLEPFFRDDHIVGVMKSFPFMEELNMGFEIIHQTGIISFYSQDRNMPFNIQRNPYKWSEYD